MLSLRSTVPRVASRGLSSLPARSMSTQVGAVDKLKVVLEEYRQHK